METPGVVVGHAWIVADYRGTILQAVPATLDGDSGSKSAESLACCYCRATNGLPSTALPELPKQHLCRLCARSITFKSIGDMGQSVDVVMQIAVTDTTKATINSE